jgi:WD40 repeat protein
MTSIHPVWYNDHNPSSGPNGQALTNSQPEIKDINTNSRWGDRYAELMKNSVTTSEFDLPLSPELANIRQKYIAGNSERVEAKYKLTPHVLVDDPRWLWLAGSYGEVKKFSLTNGKVLENFENAFHQRSIYAISATPNSKYVITSDELGHMKQIDQFDHRVLKDYGKVFKCSVTAMSCSADSQFVLVSDENGNVKQFDVNTHKLYKDYPNSFPGSILTLAITSDVHFWYGAGHMGICKKFNIRTGQPLKNFGKIHKGSIFSIALTPDCNYLFTSDKYGYVKQFSVIDDSLIKDYNKIHERFIYSMVCSPDSSWLLVSGNRGNVVQFDIKGQVIYRDFERIHEEDSDICCMVVGGGGNWFWTSDDCGRLKEWDMVSGELVRDFGKVSKGRLASFVCVS